MTTSRRKRVLLVDDDPSILEAVEIALAQRGFEVLTARDGAEGLARAERDAPDVIVLDLVMPLRSGFAVLDRLGGARAGRPRILMVTANDEPRHRAHATSRGADAFLPKPFEIDELVRRVEELSAEC